MNKYGILLIGSFIAGSMSLYAIQGYVREASLAGKECNQNYSGCVTEYNCPEVGESVKVIGDDVYGLDGDGDGTGCDRNGGTWESRQTTSAVLLGGPAGLVAGWLAVRNKITAESLRTKQQAARQQEAYLTERARSNGMLCPKCGGILKLRRGKFGQFIGCTKYPNCRYTRKPN